MHSTTKYSGERHTPFHRAPIFILTQAQFLQTDCWNDQWELSNLQRSQPHHSHLQSRLHTNCDVCFPHALDTAVGMHRNISLLVLRRGIRLCIYQEDYAILTRYSLKEKKRRNPHRSVFSRNKRNLRHTINAKTAAGIRSRALWQKKTAVVSYVTCWLQADLTAVR